MATVIRDLGFDRIVAADRELAGRGVKVGIQRDAGKEADGTKLIDIAVYNEFGTERIPSRPFIRGAADAYQADAEQVMQRIAAGEADTDTKLARLGNWYEGKVKLYARSGTQHFKPNAPSTIKQKGSSVPLIDTGKLINSIRYATI